MCANFSGLSPNGVLMRDATTALPWGMCRQATSALGRAGNGTWELGVSAEVVSIPAGFVHRTLITAAAGPTRAMVRWGELSRASAGLGSREDDVAMNRLGYFTDNGAMLYGDAWGSVHQPDVAAHNLDCCNETVLRSVLAGLEAAAVPIGWIQMDDWWYKGYLPVGGGVFCTEDWQPWPDAFPGGLDGVQTKLPWLLYAPFFCKNSTWVRKNPAGMMVSPGGYAVPTPAASASFYRELFELYAGKMSGYEVDFMIDNFLNQMVFREELGVNWLRLRAPPPYVSWSWLRVGGTSRWAGVAWGLHGG